MVFDNGGAIANEVNKTRRKRNVVRKIGDENKSERKKRVEREISR